jgi:hypothetical protein
MRLARQLLVLIVPAALAVAVFVPIGPDAPTMVGAATPAAPGSGFVVRSGHVSYESCRASEVTLTVSVARGAFVPGQLVRYLVVLRNTSSHSCTAPGAGLLHGPLPFVLGPCSPISVRIANGRGMDVYPRDAPLSCPAILGPPIPPHHAISSVGTWDQRSAVGAGQQQPPGRYTLIVGGTVRVPVRLALGPHPFPVPVPIHGGTPTTLPATRPTLPPTPTTLPRSPRPTLPTPRSPAPATRALTTRSARIRFESCQANQVVMSVSVPAQPVPLRTPVQYTVRLHNTGNTACGPPGSQVPGAGRGLSVGPCGLLSVFVSDRSGRVVYPGPMNYMCAMMAPIPLGPGATATGAGTWFQDEQTGSRGSGRSSQAPPGPYHLSIVPSLGDPGAPSARVVLPFSIAPRAGAYPVPGPTPTIPVRR